MVLDTVYLERSRETRTINHKDPKHKMQERHRFIKINEGFTCENCGRDVNALSTGSCRNHCPHCLYSKHVDGELPGDRSSSCSGLMEPIELGKNGREFVLTHRCTKCGQIRRNKTAL